MLHHRNAPSLHRMLRRLLLTAVMVATGAEAQHLQLKIGGGFAAQYGDARAVGAYKIGVGYEYEFDQHWTFAPSLLFYGKGWRTPDTFVADLDGNGRPQYDDNGNLLTSRCRTTTAADYVEIPLLFSYYHRVGEHRYLVISAGPYAALGVAGTMKTKGDATHPGSEKIYYDAKTFDSDGARRFDAGMQAFLGYQFPTSLTLGIEADFGMLRFCNGGGRNVSALIGLSYNFN